MNKNIDHEHTRVVMEVLPLSEKIQLYIPPKRELILPKMDTFERKTKTLPKKTYFLKEPKREANKNPIIGDALIQNQMICDIDEKEFYNLSNNHKSLTNDYFFVKGRFNIKHSSVAIVMTRDNFVVVGKRTQTFAWTSFAYNMTRYWTKYITGHMKRETLERLLYRELTSKFWLFSKKETDLLKSCELEKESPSLYRCLQHFPHSYDKLQIEGRNTKDLIFLGGHPNKNETMQDALLRELSEEGNITKCASLGLLGSLTIHDKRFKESFRCNLYLYHTAYCKKEVQDKFTPNKEVEKILFILLREQQAHPLEIVQNCLS